VSLFDGRCIAMVSNAPSLLGSGFGREIDEADLVLRFNRFTTAGHEADVGTRTDVYACHFLACKPQEELKRRGVQHCFVVYGWSEEQGDPVALTGTEATPVTNKCISPGFIPTTGLIVTQWLLWNTRFSRLHLYGFADNVNGHYFDKKHPMCDFHDMAKEARILENLADNCHGILLRHKDR
jgi:hypothetical protein